MNLISNAERAVYRAAIDDVHDTFARDIVVWRKSAQVLNSQDSNFDAFNDQSNSSISYTSSSQIFKARIKYIDRQQLEAELRAGDPGIGTSRIPLTESFQLVRIKVTRAARDYIEGCEKINLSDDNLDYVVYTIQRPHGVFEPTYYTYYLQSLP